MLVKEIMSSPPVTVPPTMPVPEVARLMQDRGVGSVLVVDDAGKLLGIITDGDFTGIGRAVPYTLKLSPVIFGGRPGTWEELKSIFDAATKLTARDISTCERLVTVTEDDSVGTAVHRMLTRDVKHLPVVRGAVPVGMVARQDVLKLMASHGSP